MCNDKNLVKGIEFKFVKFQDIYLLGVKGSNGKVYTPLKRICEDLGIAEEPQARKFKTHLLLKSGATMMIVPDKQNKQQKTLMVDVGFLPFWIAGLNPVKIKEQVQPYLLDFQEKVKDLLEKAFINPELAPAQPQNHRIPQSFSEALLLAGRLAQEVEEKEKRLQLSEPKAALFDVFTDTTEFKTVRQIGYKLKPYGLGPNKIFEFLREEKVLTRVNGENYPTHSYTDYFLINTVVKQWIDKKTGEQKSIAKDMLKVVPKFYLLLAKLLVKRNILTLQDFNKIDFSNVPEDHLISNKIFN